MHESSSQSIHSGCKRWHLIGANTQPRFIDCGSVPLLFSAERVLLQRRATWRDHDVMKPSCGSFLVIQSMQFDYPAAEHPPSMGLWASLLTTVHGASDDVGVSVAGGTSCWWIGFEVLSFERSVMLKSQVLCPLGRRGFITCLSLEEWKGWPSGTSTLGEWTFYTALSCNLFRLPLALFVVYLRGFTAPTLLEKLLWSFSLTGLSVRVYVCVILAFHTMINCSWPNRWPSGHKPLDA